MQYCMRKKELIYEMARFVSPHLNYSHGVRNEREAHMGLDGKIVPALKALDAQFGPDGRTDADIALAKSTFNFRGMPIYENGQELDPFYRVGVFDSEIARLLNGWTEDEEALVVEALRNHGPIGQMYVEVVPVPVEKPWNGYDDLTDADRILELALATNTDLDLVIQYERENQARPEVLALLTEARDEESETIIVSA